MAAAVIDLPQKQLGELCGLRGWKAEYDDICPEAHWPDISTLRGEVGRPGGTCSSTHLFFLTPI